ncbi:MAG: ABC transporter ATP-binding protein [Deltaproteobacteria bacterium]|nr:ABC transporter ATP-binding protein [Deltaproteobacteria bacterium]
MKVFLRLISYAKPYTWQFVCIIILGIIASAFQPGAALAVKPFLDDILIGKNKELLKLLPFIIIAFTIICEGSRYIYSVGTAYLGEKIVQTIRIQLYEKYTSFSLDYYSQTSTGKVMTVLSGDTVILLEGFGKVTSLFRDPFTMAGLLAVSFYRDWRLTLMSLLIVPPVIFMISKIGQKLRQMTYKRQDRWATLNSTIYETLSGIRIIKAFNLEKLLQRRFQNDNERLLKIQFGWIKIENLSPVLLGILSACGIAFLTIYTGDRVLSQGLSTGELLSVGVALGLLIDPIKKMNAIYIAFQKSLGAADRIFAVFDLNPTVLEKSNASSLAPFSHEIVFKNISFKYPEKEEWVLRHIDLNVRKGEVVAFVGSSGVGKTTWVNLLPRFYAIVSQDVFLFNDTVSMNIAYGDQKCSKEDIIQVAQAAHAHEFIMELPEQYDTLVGERGVKLSGGQRQRISIARALLKNAPILILDEATSSLDTESEILVQKAIEQLMKGRTSFIIAHRLSTIQHATRILVLDREGIAEEGTHDELMKKEGAYYKFYQLQFSKYAGSSPLGEKQSWL